MNLNRLAAAALGVAGIVLFFTDSPGLGPVFLALAAVFLTFPVGKGRGSADD